MQQNNKDIKELQAELRAIRAQQSTQREQVDAVADAINNEVGGRMAPDPAFCRPPIRTLLRLNTQSEVSKDHVIA
eukprot:12394660-Karenia_brevis.AAC.1